MTTEINDAVAETDSKNERKSWSSITKGFAGTIASEWFDRGELAALRRMDPDDPAPAAIRLMAKETGGDLLNEDTRPKWSLILHGIAIMTRTSGTTPQDRTAHNKSMRVGRVLFQGDGSGGERGYYSPSRFNRLMSARGPMFRTLLVRMFRMVAAANQPFNWGQMAELILYDEFDEAAAKRIRESIADDYYRAEAQAAPKSE